MAVLTRPQKDAILTAFTADHSTNRSPIAVTRPDLLTCITDIDGSIDATVATLFGVTVREPSRTSLTTRQKYDLYERICRFKKEIS
jgi:hypothetical protein